MIPRQFSPIWSHLKTRPVVVNTFPQYLMSTTMIDWETRHTFDRGQKNTSEQLFDQKAPMLFHGYLSYGQMNFHLQILSARVCSSSHSECETWPVWLRSVRVLHGWAKARFMPVSSTLMTDSEIIVLDNTFFIVNPLRRKALQIVDSVAYTPILSWKRSRISSRYKSGHFSTVPRKYYSRPPPNDSKTLIRSHIRLISTTV